MKRIFSVFFISFIFFTKAVAQNPLPDFSAENSGNNKVRISWINPFGDNCIQLMVQTSFDSIKNYRTIFSTESPQLPQNGFVYTMPYYVNMYYRIFYILNGNAYFFTPAKHATAPVYHQGETQSQQSIDPTSIITIRNQDSVVAKVLYADYYKFRDSITKNTKDTLFILSQDQVLIKPFNPENYFRPSTDVVINKDGFVTIKLPNAIQKKYMIIFFSMNNKIIFSIKHITDTELVLDKTNFLQAGWYKFELYENDKLIEKNKILLQRDF